MSLKVVLNLFQIRTRRAKVNESGIQCLIVMGEETTSSHFSHFYTVIWSLIKNNKIISSMSLQILSNRSCYGCCISWISNGARNNPQGETIRHFSVTHSNILMDEGSVVAPGSEQYKCLLSSVMWWWQFLPFGLKTRGPRDGDTCNCVDISNLLCRDWSC